MLTSIPGILDLISVSGEACSDDEGWDLVLDVPHGATRAEDFDRLLAVLRGPYEDELRDFFFVNTDAGAPELAVAIARHWVASCPTSRAVVLRSLLPRTFVDCNRIISDDVAPGMTPGLGPWVEHGEDRASLVASHAAWWLAVASTYDQLRPGGVAMQIHTYAPRSVDVTVDRDIVKNLRAAWAPGTEERWPLRPEIDLITKTVEGTRLCHDRLVESVRDSLIEAAFGVEEGRTYPLHPGTTGYLLAARHAPRVLCFEVRRDLLAEPWDPFAEMRIGGATERIAAAVVRGALAGLPVGRPLRPNPP